MDVLIGWGGFMLLLVVIVYVIRRFQTPRSE
jgi:hypothetical protein